MARSLFRELVASGYRVADLVAVATEFLDLVVRDAEAARTGGVQGGVNIIEPKAGGPGQRGRTPEDRSERYGEVTMHFENVVRFIRDLDIDARGVTLDSRLGAELGMDSQEIVELVLLIERAYGIRVPERVLSKASTVREAIEHIERLTSAQPAPARPGFDHRCEARAVIHRPRADVYRALHRLEEWTRYLPHVVGIDVLYDDGRYQEFKMRVTSKTGVLQVRSIRDCDGASSIDFFQPEPPAFLLHHAGGWRFSPVDGGERTEVLTFHEWRLNDRVARETFADSKVPYQEQVKELLLEHAKIALGHWKRALEQGRPAAQAPREAEGPVSTIPASAA